MSAVMSAVNREILNRVRNYSISNIYIGGGTPSLLDLKAIVQLFESIYATNSISDYAEITFEANPDDLKESYISGIVKYTPINRISMGVQSFIPEDLRFLNRRHSDTDVDNAVENLRYYGIKNISMDLIYGLPYQTREKWQYNIERMLRLDPEHISAYHLTYEEGTPLYRQLMNGKISEVDENDSVVFFNMLVDFLKLRGYRQYEISNFCKNGYHARLNSGYWDGSPYIGIGPSAHSYDGNRTRRFNLPNIRNYIDNAGKNEGYFSLEHLSDTDIVNELIMTRLRTDKGLDLASIKLMADIRAYDGIVSTANRYLNTGHLVIDGNVIYLTKKGMLISDSIISDFFI